MKKLIYIFSLIAVLFIFTGCGNTKTTQDDRISIIATTFPEYDWLLNVLGGEADSVDLTLLLDGSTDLHSYQPTVMDMAKIADCDLFIFNGGESEDWVYDAFDATNTDAVVLNIMDAISDLAKLEEAVEGMQSEEDEEGGDEYDEHLWLSLRNRQVATVKIKDAVCRIMPEKSYIFTKNADAYCERLKALDEKYKEAVENSRTDTLIFGDRFPFRYMLDDYGIKYYAAFPGCSTENNASFETVVFLANKADEIGAEYIFTTESADGKIANSIIENTKDKSAKVLALNSMQSGAGINDSYIDIMEENLKILEKAL